MAYVDWNTGSAVVPAEEMKELSKLTVTAHENAYSTEQTEFCGYLEMVSKVLNIRLEPTDSDEGVV